MKTIVVYYSLTGNTYYVARKIAGITGADLLRLEPKKEYPKDGFRKYFWGGKSAVFGEKPALDNKIPDLAPYDAIIVGTPIWAGTFAPPIRTFLSDSRFTGKRVFLFICCSGGDTEKCFARLEDMLTENTISAKAVFIEPLKSGDADTDEKVRLFCSPLNGDV